jgi:hypothetical protein
MKIDNWFTGIIEECDPTTNRVRVRMFGLHSFQLNSSGSPEILTTDLPWASLLLPVTTQLSSSDSIQSLSGKCAFGFFRDGSDMQDAVVIGIYQGMWNQSQLGGFNPNFNSNGYNSSMPGANEYVNTINGSSNYVSGIASGGYVPLTGAHSEDGLLKSFDQTLPGNGYDSAIASRIIQPALSQLNKNISYSGNAGQIAQYFRATSYSSGASAKEPWCAAFVCWTIQQSGLFDDAIRPKNANAFGFDDWAKQEKVRNRVAVYYKPNDIKPGDIVVFSWSHVGVAIEPSVGNNFKSVEGNTGAGIVAIRSRNMTGVAYSVRIVK